MLRVYFILLLAIGSNAVRNDDLAPAGGSSEDIDLARSRGYCDEADLDVTVCIDNLEAAKKAVEELPASSTAAVKKQKEEEFLRAQSLLNDARNRRAHQTHSAHASIVSARATKIAKNQTSTKGKEPAVDPAHNPKFLKRKLPEPKDGWRDSEASSPGMKGEALRGANSDALRGW